VHNWLPEFQGSALQNVSSITPLTTWSTLIIIGRKFGPSDFKILALEEAAMRI
jgi:hypothetical protein